MLRKIILAAVAGLAIGTSARAATFDGTNGADVFFTDTSGNLYWYKTAPGHNQVAPVNVNGTEVSGLVGTGFTKLGAGYFDPDSHMDLFANRSTGTSIGTWWFEATGAPGGITIPTARNLSFQSLTSYAVGDYNGDGARDFVMAYNTPNYQIYGYSSTGIDNGRSPGPATLTYGLPSGGTGLVQGDFNRNGNNDTFVATATGLIWYDDFADGYINKYPSNSELTTGLKGLAIGNLDDDLANNSLFVINPDGTVGWYKPDTENLAGHSATLTKIGSNFDSGASAIALGDINGDGKQELLVAHGSSGVTWYEGNGIGTLKSLAGTAFGASGIVDMVVVSAVPEPASIMLLALGGLMMVRRRS